MADVSLDEGEGDPAALSERCGLCQGSWREVQTSDVGACSGQADRVEADVALQVDHLQTSHLADCPSNGLRLNLSERGVPGHQTLGIVKPVLTVYPGPIVPVPAVEVERVSRHRPTLPCRLALHHLMGTPAVPATRMRGMSQARL